jgi:hypothetical protein
VVSTIQSGSWGQATTGTQAWRLNGKLAVTATVKGSFRLIPNGTAVALEPDPIRSREQYEKDNPFNGVIGAIETVPMTPAVDVLVTGSAHAPSGAERMSVRLAIQSGNALLLNKSLDVVGDRQNPESRATTFRQMPLSLTRAYGGIGFPLNPLGIGADANAQGCPNLVDPRDPAVVAYLGPIPVGFAQRKKRLGNMGSAELRKPILELVENFDWSYFQSAPADQRLPHLQGDEWLLLDGMHPQHASLKSQLPQLEARAAIYLDGKTDDIPMAIKMIHVDAERERLWVVWRGHLAIANESHLERLHVIGTLLPPASQWQWPSFEAMRAQVVLNTEDTHKQPAPHETKLRSGNAKQGPAVPFTQGAQVTAASSEPLAWEEEDEHPLQGGTLAMSSEALDQLTSGNGHPLEGTVTLSQTQQHKAANTQLPFQVAPPAASHAPQKASIPGAPWAKEASLQTVVKPLAPSFDTTMLPHSPSDESPKAPTEPPAPSNSPEEELEWAREQARIQMEQDEQAQREAEARRLEAAAKFREEQEQARQREKILTSEQSAKSRKAKATLRTSIYGKFKRNK